MRLHEDWELFSDALQAASQVGAIKAGQLLVEINSFANPYPFQKCRLQSFLTEFLQKTGNENLIEEYDMQPFDVNVLDRRRTLTEKLVSLLRCSLADGSVLSRIFIRCSWIVCACRAQGFYRILRVSKA